VLLGERVGVLAGGKHKRAVGHKRFWIALLIALTEGVDLGVLCCYTLGLGLDFLLVLGFGLGECGLPVTLSLHGLRKRFGITPVGLLHSLRVLGLGARNELLQDAEAGRWFRDGGREWLGELTRFEGKRRRALLERVEGERIVDCQCGCQQIF